jgi:hypothetical protein
MCCGVGGVGVRAILEDQKNMIGNGYFSAVEVLVETVFLLI